MKSLILAISLLPITSMVSAAPCSPTSKGPCTPVQDGAYDEIHAEILSLIEDAQTAEPAVKEVREYFLHTRGNHHYTAEDRMIAFLQYRDAITAQDALYEQALNKTADLYHVRPLHTGTITIGQPDDADKQYMTGLRAFWRPKATDSGPGVNLAVRIEGNDGPHYMGATKMDPRQPGGRLGTTLDDGRVLITKDTFAIAIEKGNLGFLAAVIYHETRHFDRLSWKDKSGKNRSWATPDEGERDAYEAEARMGRVFGLSDADIAGLKSQARAYAKALETGIPITDAHLDLAQENTWKNYYDHVQINLEEEYAKLRKAVKDESARQKGDQEQRRLAREKAAREEQARRNEQTWQRIEAAALQCGYQVAYQGNTGNFLGFERQNDYLLFSEINRPALDVGDLKIMLLIGNTCFGIKQNVWQAPPPACNDSASVLHARASLSDFPAKLNAMFGARSSRSACVNEILDRASEIGDTPAFNRFATAYQKELKKAADKREKDAREESEREKRERRRNRGGGGTRPPPPSDDQDYIWNTGCECWIRKQ